MPELPEVETVRRELEPWLTGRTIVRARRAEAPPGPKYRDLERADGQRISAVTRRGKFLLLPLGGGDELVVHLGMTGRISSRDPKTHVRVQVELSGRRRPRLFFQDMRRFGRFLVVRAGDYTVLPTLAHLGPEPLDAAFTPAVLHNNLQQSRAPIKAYILGQRPVAGVGNIYADESLWRARIHPATPARRVSRRKTTALHTAIVDILTAAVEARGTTFRDYRTVSGEQGGFVSLLQIYGRDGEPCPRCARTLSRFVIGQRGTTACTRCQRR